MDSLADKILKRARSLHADGARPVYPWGDSNNIAGALYELEKIIRDWENEYSEKFDVSKLKG